MSMCCLVQSAEFVISLSRSYAFASSRAVFPTTISDIIQSSIGVWPPAYLLTYCCIVLTWIYYYRFQVTSAYGHWLGPDIDRETTPGQWVPIIPPLHVQDCPCHIRKAASGRTMDWLFRNLRWDHSTLHNPWHRRPERHRLPKDRSSRACRSIIPMASLPSRGAVLVDSMSRMVMARSCR